MRRIFIALAFCLCAAAPVAPLEFSRSGNRVLISGFVKVNDENEFERFMAANGNSSATQAVLNSGGGSVNSAIEIARYFRSHGMSTYVDGRSGHCESACTILFGGGVQRYYVNTQGMASGVQGAGGTGLGFHQATTSLSQQPGGFSGAGTAMVVGAYYEMGIGNASTLADRAPPNKIYRLSGEEALKLGIATALGVK